VLGDEVEEEEEEEMESYPNWFCFFLCADYNYFFCGAEDFLVRKWYGLIISAK
jgi:hypothetical protein